jgi:hypothetical protein
MSSGHHLRVESAEPVGRPILARQDGVHTRHLLRCNLVDGADPGMRMWREHEDSVRLAHKIDVRDIAPLPGQEPGIFFACNRLSDAEPHDPSPDVARSLQQRARGVDATIWDEKRPII